MANPTAGSNKPVTRDPSEVAQNRPRYYIPRADIIEGKEGVTLYVDMPGVKEKTLNINIEKNTLTIEGQVEMEARPQTKAYLREYGEGDYRRIFTLADEVDTEKVSASFNHGVLTLELPKSERHKPRKIAVKVG